MGNEIVEMLREKTEETDLDRILQPRMGGYSKKSVQEYLAQMKRQQQSSAEAFNRELQSTLDEKDGLQKENAALKNRLQKAETDYRDLSQSMASYRVQNSELTMEDVQGLRDSLAALEKDMQEAVDRIHADEQAQEQLQYQLEQARQTEQKAQQEAAMYREMLAAARGEAAGLRKTVSEQATSIAQLQAQEKFLRQIVSEGNVAQLQDRIAQLLGTTKTLQEEIAARDETLESRARRLEQLEQQELVHHRGLEQANAAAEENRLRNEKLEAENKALAERMEELLGQNVAHFRERAALQVEKEILLRRLDQGKLDAQLAAVRPDAAPAAAAKKA
jgi:chromosome segregation ATPase